MGRRVAGGGALSQDGRKVVNVIEDPDSAQHTQRSTFRVQATGIRASRDLDKAGEAIINKITCSIIRFSCAVTEPDGTRPGGLGEGRFLKDVRAELEGSRIQMLQTGRGKIVAGRVPSTGEAETHVTTLWALGTWPPQEGQVWRGDVMGYGPGGGGREYMRLKLMTRSQGKVENVGKTHSSLGQTWGRV